MAARKITKISRAQEELLPQARDEWLAAGLSTDPADRDTATAAVRAMYGEINEPAPMVFWLDSPWAAALGSTWVSMVVKLLGSQLDSQLYSQLRSQLDSQLDSQLYSQLDSQLDLQLYSQLRSQLYSQLGSQIRSQLYSQLYSQLRSQLGSQLYSQLGSQLGLQLYSQLRSQLDSQLGLQLYSQLRSQLDSQLGSQLGSQIRSQLDSQLDSQLRHIASHWWSPLWSIAWAAFYELGARWGVKYDAKPAKQLGILCRWLKTATWMWPMKGAVVLSEHPTVLKRDDQRNLHSDTGPAVAYRDGWGVWAIHGVRLTQQIVEQPDTLTVEQIRGEGNVEVRRVMLERFGPDRYLRESGAQLLDHVHEPPFRGLVDAKLWRTEVGDDEPLVMLECVNSTPEHDGEYKRYWLRVPPATTNAHEAVAWTWDMPAAEYAPAVET